MTQSARSIAAYVALGVAALWLLGFHVPWHTGAAAAPAGRALVVVLGDNSLDASASDLRQAQEAVALGAKIAQMNGGRLVAATFQGQALAQIQWPIDHIFIPDPSLPANSKLRADDLARQVTDMDAAARRLFDAHNRRGVEGTDVVGSTIAAAEVFRSDPAATPKILVLVSNMLDVTPADGLSMTRQRISGPFVRSALRRLTSPRRKGA